VKHIRERCGRSLNIANGCPSLAVMAVLIGTIVSSACSGGNSAAPEVVQSDAGAPSEPEQLADPRPQGPTLHDETSLALPPVHSSETLADSGLQVAFTSAGLRESIDPLFIERQWLHMQTCVAVTAAAPLIIVVDGSVSPLTPDDDVLHHIDGSVTASASQSASGATVQISHADFDGTLGNVGFNLRSILGRYLWLSTGLAERDYPYTCAREIA